MQLFDSKNTIHKKICVKQQKEGDVRVCGDAVLGYFWCGFAVSFILTCDIAFLQHKRFAVIPSYLTC